jgi:hypothetical protein
VRWATKQEQVDNRRIKRIEQFSDAVICAEFNSRGLGIAQALIDG